MNDEQTSNRPPPMVLLLATVAQVGRVRLSKRELSELGPGDKLDVRTMDDGGVTVTYRRGE